MALMRAMVLLSISRPTSNTTTTSARRPPVQVTFKMPPQVVARELTKQQPAPLPRRARSVKRSLSTATLAPRPAQRPVRAPVATAINTIRVAPNPVMTVTRRELVGVVRAQGTTNSTYIVNARNSIMFPWLSTLAANFDMYYFSALSLEYEPICPAASTTGAIAMAFDYDVTDANTETSFESLCAYGGAVSGQVYAPMSCSFNVNNTVMPAHKYFCSSSSTADRLSDMARAVVKTNSSYDNGFIFGSLYVRYTCHLHDPEKSSGSMTEATSIIPSSPLQSLISAANADPLGTLATLNQLVQKNPSPDTDGIRVVPTIISGAMALAGTIILTMLRERLTTINPTLLTGWTQRVCMPEAQILPVEFAAIPGTCNVILPGKYTDYLAIWHIVGAFTNIEGQGESPLLKLDLNNFVVKQCYQNPADAADDPIYEGNNHLMVGFAYLHMPDKAAPGAICYEVESINGAWTGVLPRATGMTYIGSRTSWFTLMPAPHLTDPLVF